MTTLNSSLPLAGVRVLDLSRILAGPWCGMVLADLGAEVIKVEHPGRGDDTRDWGLRVGKTETAYFNSVNRNKRSITLDLQTPEGQQIARDLARQSDVVIQNFKFGGIDKLGLGYAQLSADQPGLIYCSITGYDTSGPEAARPGYDLVVQGEAGLMALNGEADQPPLKFGVAAVDCGLMITAYYGLEALLANQDPPRYGNSHPSIVPYGVFDAADGPLVITVGNNAQFARFCNDVIDRPDLAADERFKTNVARAANREALLPELLREIGSRKRADLLALLSRFGIPCGEVLGLLEALKSQRATDAGLVTKQPHSVAGSVDVLAPPYRFDGERLPVRSAPPQLGEGTNDVLKSLLGLSDEKLAQLKAQGVL
jgi:crotonobetainyl-CoA:carnitine CoA-transferase CaiB-like acyl-CoA transferase